jgi:hypothetical protein
MGSAYTILNSNSLSTVRLLIRLLFLPLVLWYTDAAAEKARVKSNALARERGFCAKGCQW